MQVYDIMAATAIDMGAPGFDFDSGAGLVDALAAVARAKETVLPIVDPPPVGILALLAAIVASVISFIVGLFFGHDSKSGDVESDGGLAVEEETPTDRLLL